MLGRTVGRTKGRTKSVVQKRNVLKGRTFGRTKHEIFRPIQQYILSKNNKNMCFLLLLVGVNFVISLYWIVCSIN